MNYQLIWDTQLVYGFRAGISMNNLVYRFLLECNYDLFKRFENADADLNEVKDFITSLKLNRCMDRRKDDELPSFIMLNSAPVRAFVADRCGKLTSNLYSEKLKTEDILGAISRYKWTRSILTGADRERTKMIRDQDRTKFVSARNLSKKHNWSVVK